MKKLIVLLAGALIASLPVVGAFAEEASPIAEPKPAEVRAENTIPAPPQKTIKIGFIDMAKIATDSAPGKAAYAEVKAKAEKYQKQIKAKEQKLLKQKNAFEAQVRMLSPQQREAKAKEFQKSVADLQKFVQNADKDVRAREGELLTKLYQSIEKAAGSYGKTNGFSAIVIKKEILFVGDGVDVSDLTAEMIKLVDAAKENKP